MTEENPLRLEDGSYQFPDGIVVSALAIKTHTATSGMTNPTIEVLEQATGCDIALAYAKIIHQKIVKANEEEERAKLACEEEVAKRRQRKPNAGRKVIEEGRVFVIKGGAVLETLPEFTDEEYAEIGDANPRIHECAPCGRNFPIREVRLPGKYPEYRVFVGWEKFVF